MSRTRRFSFVDNRIASNRIEGAAPNRIGIESKGSEEDGEKEGSAEFENPCGAKPTGASPAADIRGKGKTENRYGSSRG